MSGLRVATSFLTRLPVGGRRAGSADIGRGVPWFPVVGALLGLGQAGVYAGARQVLPPVVAAVLAVAFAVWATGAFHEDGLADTADAFGAARSRDETLRVLKDPRLGTFGVAALVLDLLLRTTATAHLDAVTALWVLPAAHALSRAGACALLLGPVATEDGLGAAYARSVGAVRVAAALVLGSAVAVAALGPLALFAAMAVGVCTLGVFGLARRRIGGVTGDVVGAAQQAGEIAVLLVALAASRSGSLTVSWW